MLIDALVLIAVGVVALIAPLSTAYRTRLVRKLAEQAGAEVPPTLRATLEARVTRRALGAGAGIVLAGATLLLLRLARPDLEEHGGGFLVISLMFVLGAAGVTVADILVPAPAHDGPRAARASVPVLEDYLPQGLRAFSWIVTTLGLVALVATLALGATDWFDAGTLWRSVVPVLAVALPVIALLSALAMRRLLDAPQPARDETELYWQDAVRADTLASLALPAPLVGLLGLSAAGRALDHAATVAAEASGQVGPAWSTAVLLAGYLLPMVLLVVVLASVAARGLGETDHFRDRLWGGRVPQESGTGARA